VLIVESHRNEGGAGGFATGLAWALHRGHDLAWLMDDDAEPYPDCLDQLLLPYSGDVGRYSFTSPQVVDREGRAGFRKPAGAVQRLRVVVPRRRAGLSGRGDVVLRGPADLIDSCPPNSPALGGLLHLARRRGVHRSAGRAGTRHRRADRLVSNARTASLRRLLPLVAKLCSGTFQGLVRRPAHQFAEEVVAVSQRYDVVVEPAADPSLRSEVE
jgi:hypothetical protein